MRRNFARVGLSSVLLTAAACATPTGPASAACPPPVPAIAHRGGTEKYVENTRNAFRYATSVGVNRWETDVRWDKTGLPFIHHNRALGDTTNWSGNLDSYDMSAARSQGLRTKDGQYVPSLYEVLTDASARSAQVLVELKSDPGDPFPTAVELDRVIARIDWTSMRSRVVITSFNTDVIKAFRARPNAAGINTALIASTGDQALSDITPYGTSYVKHWWSITGARLDRWSGPENVYAWTVDSTSGWQQMNWYRAEPGRLDGIITNKPGAYQAYIKTLGC